MSGVVDLSNVSVSYRARGEIVQALAGITLDVASGTTTAVVGESGCGKSTLASLIACALPQEALVAGEVRVADHDLVSLDVKGRQAFRREVLGYVYQSPRAALDPTRRVGRLVADALGLHPNSPSIHEVLGSVGLPQPERVARSYPHELSGGMAQRVSIALATCNKPKLLIADEPTSGVDASLRASLVDLLFSFSEQGDSAVIIFTHDLDAIPLRGDHLIVMLGGSIVERGPAGSVLSSPSHPYTRNLLSAVLTHLQGRTRRDPGRNDPLPAGRSCCPYSTRCPYVLDKCRQEFPPVLDIDGVAVLCWRAHELANLSSGDSGGR